MHPSSASRDTRAEDLPVSLIRVRELQPADIACVNKLYRGAYGDYPYQLKEVNPDEVALVATLDERIVAIARAATYYGHSHVWSLGGLVVHPDLQGKGIAKRLTKARIEAVRTRGAVAIVSEPVCYDRQCRSQRNLFENYGFIPLGIQPFQHPGIKEEVLGDQPESLLFTIRTFDGDSGLGTRRLFLPTRWENLPACLFPEQIQSRRWNRIPNGSMPRTRHHNPRPGRRTKGSAFADVPANWPESPAVMEELMGNGYKFSAILPGMGRTVLGEPYDLIRLYKPPTSMACTFDLVHVVPELERLKAFMAEELSN